MRAVRKDGGDKVVTVEVGDTEREFRAEGVLVATDGQGWEDRRPRPRRRWRDYR